MNCADLKQSVIIFMYIQIKIYTLDMNNAVI